MAHVNNTSRKQFKRRTDRQNLRSQRIWRKLWGAEPLETRVLLAADLDSQVHTAAEPPYATAECGISVTDEMRELMNHNLAHDYLEHEHDEHEHDEHDHNEHDHDLSLDHDLDDEDHDHEDDHYHAHDHHDEDELTCRDALGNIYFMEPAETPSQATAGDGLVWQTYPLSSTFALESLPGADHTIYLDFDGHVTQGTAWNTSFNNGQDIVTPAWSADANRASFTDSELYAIQRMWQSVAEDFAPFEVNVSTHPPDDGDLAKSGSNDDKWGIRVVIGQNTFFSQVGGVAYLNSFNWSTDVPTFVFNTSENGVAEAISHEVGHTLGLLHDGTTSETYYAGHGSGETGWAPIMGVGYYQNLVQWSRGEYAQAIMQQDDLAIITTQNGFGYRVDDYGDQLNGASLLMDAGYSTIPETFGIIERSTDVDMFTFWAGSGQADIQVDPLAANSNLDVQLSLYDQTGELLATSNPANLLAASLSYNLPTESPYYVAVSGVGLGDVLTTGYSDYGSLGNYRITGSVPAFSAGNLPPVAQDDGVVTAPGESTTIAVLANDLDSDGDPLFVQSLTQPSHGVAVKNADNTITYTPTAGFTGTDAFQYTIGDGEGHFDTATVTIDIASPVQIVDDGDSAYGQTSGWVSWTGNGRGNDLDYAAAGSGTTVATWTFNVAPGEYRVSTTWLPHSNRATNAPYDIYNGAAAQANRVGGAQINQELSPNDFSEDGSTWEDVGTVTVSGNLLTVTLSNAANEYVIADAVRIERVDNVPLAPEITVLEGTTEIADNGNVDWGSALVGAATTKSFIVRNDGSEALTLGGAISVPGGYTLTSNFSNTTLQPGDQTSFSVQLDAAAAGTYAGQISFANNDADENPYNFFVTAEVADLPTTQIVDNGGPGFSTVGGWTTWNGGGHDNDLLYAAAGNGSAVATWSFDVSPGRYSIAVTYLTHSNRASNAPYTVYDGAAASGNQIGDVVAVNQKIAPNDFSDANSGWLDIGDFDVTGDQLSVTLNNLANSYVIADAVRVERVADAPSGPEIAVYHGEDSLSDGGQFDWGSVEVDAFSMKTFTVRNIGNESLTLDSTIALPNGFSLASGFTAATLAPDAETTFAVELNTDAAATYSGNVSFANNDADESPFNFTITANVADLPTVQIVDDGDSEYSITGGWGQWASDGHDGDLDYAAPGSGTIYATWTFTVTPGSYRVSATWLPHPNRATDAPYAIYAGSVSSGTQVAQVDVNQEAAPSQFSDAGSSWNDLGTVQISGSTLSVTLSNAANQYVIADAIRIERAASGILMDGPVFIQAGSSTTSSQGGLEGPSFNSEEPLNEPIVNVDLARQRSTRPSRIASLQRPALTQSLERGRVFRDTAVNWLQWATNSRTRRIADSLSESIASPRYDVATGTRDATFGELERTDWLANAQRNEDVLAEARERWGNRLQATLRRWGG